MIEIKNKKTFSGKVFFTVSLDGTEINDCKIVDGANGRFVSGPAKKFGEKWFPLVKFSEVLQRQIIEAFDGGSDDDDVPY